MYKRGKKMKRCPICKMRIPSKTKSCPICGTTFSKIRYFIMNYLFKVIAALLIVEFLFNCFSIIIINKKIRRLVQNPPEKISVVEELQNCVDNVNSFQKQFIHDSELESLLEKYVNKDIKGNISDSIVTLYFDDGSKSGTYSGDLLNGHPHGNGSFEYCSENGDGFTYTGEFTESTITGYGTLTKEDGTKYVGNFVHGSVNGQCTIYNKDDYPIIEGEFVNNLLHGNGVIRNDDGTIIYQGEFYRNIPSENKYKTLCEEVDASYLCDNISLYNLTNIKTAATIVDIIAKDTQLDYILITEDNDYIYLNNLSSSQSFSNQTEVVVYGFCHSSHTFTDTSGRALRGIKIDAYYINEKSEA